MMPNPVWPMRHVDTDFRPIRCGDFTLWLICVGLGSLLAGCGPQLVDSQSSASIEIPSGTSVHFTAVVTPPASSSSASGTASSAQAAVPKFRNLPRKEPSEVVVLRRAEGEAVYHQVRQGETLFRISRDYRLSLAALIDANGLDLQAVLHPGQLLYIPRPAHPQE
jgi:LysM repeat protein